MRTQFITHYYVDGKTKNIYYATSEQNVVAKIEQTLARITNKRQRHTVDTAKIMHLLKHLDELFL